MSAHSKKKEVFKEKLNMSSEDDYSGDEVEEELPQNLSSKSDKLAGLKANNDDDNYSNNSFVEEEV